MERVGGEFDFRPEGGTVVCPIFDTIWDGPSELFEYGEYLVIGGLEPPTLTTYANGLL